MTDHSYEMASAYCDDELNQAQRAIVEGDPGMLALVSEIRSLQAQTAALAAEPVPEEHHPDAATRQGHLAAASAAFAGLFTPSMPVTAAAITSPSGSETASTATTTSPASPVIDLRSRPKRHMRILSMAAGLVVVAGIGLLALIGLQGSDDSDDTAAVYNDTETTTQSLDATREALPEAMANESVAVEDTAAAADGAASLANPTDTEIFDKADASEESKSGTVVLASGLAPPLFVFDEGTELTEIAETVGRAPDLEPLLLCTLWGYTPEQTELDVPIQVGETLLGYALVDDAGILTAILYGPECDLLEIEPLAD